MRNDNLVRKCSSWAVGAKQFIPHFRSEIEPSAYGLPQRVLDIAAAARDRGVDRFCVADTIGTTTPGNLLVVGGSGSPAYCNGTSWVNGSDRNSKEAFTAINPRAVLEKVSALPITEWKYKTEADGTEHIGPMAQDFHTAFGLNGTDDKHIATVDEEGVALAAIQGLNQKMEAETKAKDAEIQELKQSVAELKVLVEKLAAK